MKRAGEFTLALCGLVFLAVPMAFISGAVWLQDRRSPFYRGIRVGMRMRELRMLKFRTMVADASRSGVNSTASGDRRITRVGAMLRRCKLDELPQLWNVLTGGMSLVGPRPQVPAEAALYTIEECRLLDVRPGITDLASIVFADEGEILAGSADPDLLYNQIIRPWKSRLALAYIDHASLGLDFRILALTLLAAFSRPRALDGVARLLESWDAEPGLRRAALRRTPLDPWPPPGATEIVSRYPRAEAAGGLMVPLCSMLRRNRRLIVDLIHLTLAAAAFAAGFLLRFDFSLRAPYIRTLAVSLPLAVALKLGVFRAFSLRDLAWRYFGISDLKRIAASNLTASVAAALVLSVVTGWAFPGTTFPRSIYVIDLLAASVLMATAHAVAKALADVRHTGITATRTTARRRRVAIYGAGQAGALLLGEIRANPQLGFEAAGFFDDDPLKRDLRVHGVRVLGGREALPAAVRKRGIQTVLIALPYATGGQITAILEQCSAAHVPAKRVPALEDLTANGEVLARRIRDIRIEDLLGRRPVELETAKIRMHLKGRIALVTGAGGSIGAELCRQIARHEPAAIVGLDHSEAALYEIDREMHSRFPGVCFHPEIGSIRDRRRLEEVFGEHAPDSVYHAAAYKHVPLMESRVLEALENNVFGTRNVAQAAAASGAGTFVLISSDKAVRPANVMGVTKRLAEMVVQSMATALSATPIRTGRTRFMAVRFGNVLGSSGSVIPLFRQQIAAGGPVTVTHPEMRRFFMTVSEAGQLVLEAAAMGRGGEIFTLEMGEPVRILDLARKMILLSGLRPGQDIRIEFSGIRPGEKLYEELSAYEEDTLPTPHSQIRVFSGPPVSQTGLARSLESLRLAASEGDAGRVLLQLQDLVPGYDPSDFVVSKMIRRTLEESAHGAFA